MDRRLAQSAGGRGSLLDPRGAGSTRMNGGRARVLDDGMVTAELAVGIMSVVVVLAVMLFAIGVGIAHVRTQEGARAGARAAARGDSAGEVRSVAQAAAPGSRVTVRRRGTERVVVDVSVDIELPVIAARTITVGARSIAEVEPK